MASTSMGAGPGRGTDGVVVVVEAGDWEEGDWELLHWPDDHILSKLHI